MAGRKTFREKLAEEKDLPRVQELTGGMKERFGPGTIVLPSAREVDEIMGRVPKGKLVTINQIRDALAKRHRATVSCPIVTGIHARICAGAAQEEEEEGRRRITPYWRTLKSGGEVNPKYPGGVAGQKARLEAEGHTVVARGKRWVVEDYESALVALA